MSRYIAFALLCLLIALDKPPGFPSKAEPRDTGCQKCAVLHPYHTNVKKLPA